MIVNREELIGKLQMVYVGDKNALNELIGYYDGLKDVIKILQQENARLKDNWKQLEKFICYEQDRLLKATSHVYQDSFDKIKLVNSDIFEELKKVENKIKELFKEN